MDHPTPLSMPEAQAIWLHRLPELYVETVNYLRGAPLTRPKGKGKAPQATQPKRVKHSQSALNFSLAREAIVTNERLHEDIVQELGIRFFRKVAEGKVWAGTQIIKDERTNKEKEVACADCWLTTVLWCVAHEYAYKEARQYLHRGSTPRRGNESAEAALAPEMAIASREPSPEQIVSARERLSLLAPKLRCFPKRERQIFLRHLDEDSHREIAIDLNMTEQAVRSSVHRTRKKLLLQAERIGYEPWPQARQRNAGRKLCKVKQPELLPAFSSPVPPPT
jgi:RNA polymerase sigma factor (sigma-70 family)